MATDVLYDDIKESIEKGTVTVENIHGIETSYDYFQVECTIDGVDYRILDTRCSRCSDMVFTDTSHTKNHTVWLIEKLGYKGNPEKVLTYTFNHNPSTWDEPYDDYDGGFDGYYGDGLDHIEELWYLD